MQNISFDDGVREFMINNNPNRIITFSPADFSILERFNTAMKEIENAYNKIDKDVELNADGSPVENLDEYVEIIKRVNMLINEQVDYIFGSSVSAIAFGNQSLLVQLKGCRYLNVL